MKFLSSFPASFIATGTLIRRFHLLCWDIFQGNFYYRHATSASIQAQREDERAEDKSSERKKRERRRERESRERVRSRRRGLNKMEKMVLLCWWMHEEAVDRGSRRAAEFTPHLEKALFRALYPVCSFPFLLPLSAFSPSLSLSRFASRPAPLPSSPPHLLLLLRVCPPR